MQPVLIVRGRCRHVITAPRTNVCPVWVSNVPVGEIGQWEMERSLREERLRPVFVPYALVLVAKSRRMSEMDQLGVRALPPHLPRAGRSWR